MKRATLQGHAELRKEMKSVAKGERPALRGAGQVSFESVEALMRLLTPENRALLAANPDRLSAFVDRQLKSFAVYSY